MAPFMCVIAFFGVPKKLVFYHGNKFRNEVFQELHSHLGFTHEFVSPYYLQSNHKLDIINKILKTML